MANQQKLTKFQNYLLGNPAATVDDIVRDTGAARRTIYYVEANLVKEDFCPPTDASCGLKAATRKPKTLQHQNLQPN